MPLNFTYTKQAANDIVDNFAYVGNGELIINGTGTLQVFDILGRQVFISNQMDK